MNKFFWGVAFGFMLAVVIHSFSALKTLQQVFG
ncbi:hypothetical protein PF621_gp12 [Salmonella phage vB_SenTO17]|uniref:Uncharacterized protein n=1 Tax=Salmonella phage vB_SenTO17 TaxID=2732254 RepID=A0A7G3T3F7_9CAUD|nr:hypothetical protein PF621_gp12 [Salmonella phage vB_SenTO17]QJQ80395.1 hypothetical protein vBSenTO17_12 [Salmonella phage vB_SenTO17]